MTKFRDDKRFTRGFKKSGHFSIREAELLEQYGQIFYDLESGRHPRTQEELSFRELLDGKRLPESDVERVWAKYKALCNKKLPRMFSGSGGGFGDSLGEAPENFATIVPKGSLTKRFK